MIHATTIFKVQKHIDRIINSLLPFYEFANTQMVPWLTDKLWEKYVSDEIRNEIRTKDDVKLAIDLFFQHDSPPISLIKRFPALHKHIEERKTFFLENFDDKIYLNENELMDEFKRLKIPINTGLAFNVKEFTSLKKNHEVEVASSIVGTLAKARGKEHFVLDVGDGKGYLSSRLAVEFNLKVLGVDGNANNSIEALKRNEKFTKAWKHLVRKGAERNKMNEPEEVIIPSDQYKTASAMIFGETNLMKLIDEAYPNEDIEDICIAGLHTCGNLGPNTLKQFVKNDKIKVVMSIPCCFNLIHEEFTRDYFNDIERKNECEGDYGFPLSDHLRSKKFKLGRNARMLATQCLERIVETRKMPEANLYYRAILEKLLRERWLKDQPVLKFKIGKIKNCQSLEEYLKKGCKKLNIDMDLTTEQIAIIEKDHELDRELMTLHYFLRLLLAKSIETLISLDRFLYLLERNIRHVYLVKLFDPAISPRNLAVIAIKD